MFGYIKPCKPELRMKEYDAYRAVYCGLCRQMGGSFGPLARLTLSYDFAFLCMLRYGVTDGAPKISTGRCCVNPLKKVPMCEPDETLRYGADIAAIMIYYKLLDNIQDSGAAGKIAWSLLRPVVSAAHKKAAGARPDEEAAVARSIEKQRVLEEAKTTGADAASEPTATAMGEILSGITNDKDHKRILERLGYIIGRYVYLCDALDDMHKDHKNGGYNPYLIGLPAGNGGCEAIEAARENARQSLFMTTGEAGLAYGLLSPSVFQPVLDNIIYMGLASEVRRILSGKGKREQ